MALLRSLVNVLQLNIFSLWLDISQTISVLCELWKLFILQFPWNDFTLEVVLVQLYGVFFISLIIFKQSTHKFVINPRLKGLPTSMAVIPSWTEEGDLSMMNGDGRRCNTVPCSCPQLHISHRLKGPKANLDKCSPKYLCLKDLDLIPKNEPFRTTSKLLYIQH